MNKNSIELKRNIVTVQLHVFFIQVFAAGCVAFLIYYIGLRHWDKIFLSVMFVFEFIVFLKFYFDNKKFVNFTENEIQICKPHKKSTVVLESFAVDAIKTVVCDDRRKVIKFLYNNCPEKYFFKLKYASLSGEEVYFKLKSALCKSYPTKTVACRDEYVEKYLKEEVLPDFIKSKCHSELCGAIVLLFFEFILAIIPIGLTVLSVIWSFLRLIILLLQGVVIILNLFA